VLRMVFDHVGPLQCALSHVRICWRWIRSWQVHLQNSGYMRANESEVAENLIRAAKNMSAEELQAALDGIGRAFLDLCVVKYAKRLTIERISGFTEEDDGDAVRSPTRP
jgi:hypothetical protein